MDTHVTMISGIVSAYTYRYNNKDYFLFGDHHFSRAGECTDQYGVVCDGLDKELNLIEGYSGNPGNLSSSCITIELLLHNWFLYNNSMGIPTDFYIENFFTKENSRYTTNLTENYSWLQLINILLKSCLVREKQACPYYPNIHIHYADIRAVKTDRHIISSDPFLSVEDLSYELQVNYQMKHTADKLRSLKSGILSIFNILIYDAENIYYAITRPDGFLEFINKWKSQVSTDNTTFSQPVPGQDMSPKTTISFAERLYLQIADNMERLTVNRYGGVMHRVAAELQKLRTIDPEMAALVNKFGIDLINKYAQEAMIDYDAKQNAWSPWIDKLIDSRDYDRAFNDIIVMISEMKDVVVTMSTISMDVYTLSRIFTQNVSQQIIVFAGSMHIDHYDLFFRKYVNIRPIFESPVTDDNNRCINSNLLSDYISATTHRNYKNSLIGYTRG